MSSPPRKVLRLDHIMVAGKLISPDDLAYCDITPSIVPDQSTVIANGIPKSECAGTTAAVLSKPEVFASTEKFSSSLEEETNEMGCNANDLSPAKEKKIIKAKEKNQQPIEGRCHYFVERKRRYCKAPPHLGRQYCIEHSHVLGDPTLRKRIRCPLDPKHTCYEDQLNKHMNKCNSREAANPTCYVRNLNAGSDEEEGAKNSKVGIRSVSDDEVFEVIEKLQIIYKDFEEPKCEVLFHDVLKEEASKLATGCPALKHIQQLASLVRHMDRLGMLKDHRNYVEFGAGKGGLSHWVQLAVNGLDDTRFLLIDKSSVRYKKDNYHKGIAQGPTFERIKIDIEHLSLERIASLKGNPNPIVAMGKHLCGRATDLTLRCLVHLGAETRCDIGIKKYIDGLAVALCCHHRCDWRTYVGKNHVIKNGLTARQFQLIASMTSWATCAAEPVQTDTEEHSVVQEVHKEYNHPRYGSLLPQEREKIGRWCKNFIDVGRVEYLRDNGLETELVAYISRDYTLENIALLTKLK